MTKNHIHPATIAHLRQQIPQFIGIKVSNQDVLNLQTLLDLMRRREFSILTGSELLIVIALQMGCSRAASAGSTTSVRTLPWISTTPSAPVTSRKPARNRKILPQHGRSSNMGPFGCVRRSLGGLGSVNVQRRLPTPRPSHRRRRSKFTRFSTRMCGHILPRWRHTDRYAVYPPVTMMFCPGDIAGSEEDDRSLDVIVMRQPPMAAGKPRDARQLPAAILPPRLPSLNFQVQTCGILYGRVAKIQSVGLKRLYGGAGRVF